MRAMALFKLAKSVRSHIELISSQPQSDNLDATESSFARDIYHRCVVPLKIVHLSYRIRHAASSTEFARSSPTGTPSTTTSVGYARPPLRVTCNREPWSMVGRAHPRPLHSPLAFATRPPVQGPSTHTYWPNLIQHLCQIRA